MLSCPPKPLFQWNKKENVSVFVCGAFVQQTSFPSIARLGINLFNFSHQAEMGRARRELGETVCIFGNLAPYDCLTQASPAQCAREATRILDAHGAARGLILSGGGGASMGMPRENMLAVQHALQQWNARRASRWPPGCSP